MSDFENLSFSSGVSSNDSSSGGTSSFGSYIYLYISGSGCLLSYELASPVSEASYATTKTMNSYIRVLKNILEN